MVHKYRIPLSVIRAIFRGTGSTFYYGDTIVHPSLQYYRSDCSDVCEKKIFDIYEVGTQELLEFSKSEVFFGVSLYEKLLQKFSNVFEHHPKISNHNLQTQKKRSIECSYSIVTPFHTHLEFFKRCAASVNRLATYAISRGVPKFEWIIVNDDPRFSEEDLLSVIPDPLRPFIKMLNNSINSGIVYSLNRGIEAAKCDWTLLLDCDDMLRYDALAVLDYYANMFPRISYITSTMIDIFEDGSFIRPRLRQFSQSMTAEKGMIFGHLKAYKRDAVNLSYGWHDHASEGCQDYELALKIAKSEAILMIPEPLYYYRWHQKSQSIGNALKQSSRSTQVVRNFIAQNIVRGAEQQETNLGHNSDITLTIYVVCHVDDLIRLEKTVNSASAIQLTARIVIIFFGQLKFCPDFVNDKINDMFDFPEIVDPKFLYCNYSFVSDVANHVKQLIQEEKMVGCFDNNRRLLLVLSSGDELSPFFVEKFNTMYCDQINYDTILLKTDQGSFRPLVECNEHEYRGCESSSDAFITEYYQQTNSKIITNIIDKVVAEIKTINPINIEMLELSLDVRNH